MAIKRCPKCGSDTIMAKVIYGATLQSLEDGTFKIIQQGKNFDVEPVKCMRCKSEFDNGLSDLVEMQLCKKCGKPSIDIDENGECDICRVLKTRPELAKLSTEDVLRMYLQLEKTVNSMPQAVQLAVNKTEGKETTSEVIPMNPPVEEQVTEEKPEITNTAAEKVAAAQQAIEQAQSMESTEEASVTRKRKVSKKKSSDETTDVEETSIEKTSVSEVPAEESAPLNDVDPFSANTTGFDMFGQTTETPAPSVPEMPMPMFEEEQAF